MKEHRGMRPQDVAILLKIATFGRAGWHGKDLAYALYISASEVSESLNRSSQAGLLDRANKVLMREAVLEFLEHGLKYVYPARPGGMVRGLPTAHSAPPLNELIRSDEMYVWPCAEADARGQTIRPLYSAAAQAAQQDPLLYELLALTDALRIGRAREQKLAVKEIRERIP